MSTRCTTHVYADRADLANGRPPMVTIYRHCDGYPTGQGKTILETFRRDFRGRDKRSHAASIDDFAATLIFRMKQARTMPDFTKEGPHRWRLSTKPHKGNVYIEPPGEEPGDLEYVYHVFPSVESWNVPTVRIEAVNLWNEDTKQHKRRTLLSCRLDALSLSDLKAAEVDPA